MPAPLTVIVNPMSNGGRTRKRWPSVEPRVRAALGAVQVCFTEAPGDAIRLARRAAEDGALQVVVVGGDGSLSEAATGILEAAKGDRVALGLLPMGTGCDFARSVGIPRKLDAALEALVSRRTRRVDAGLIQFEDENGQTRSRFFLNVASFGLSGLTDLLVAKAGRSLGPTAAFALGSLRAIREYDSPAVALDVDGERVFEGRLSLGVAANGRFFGSGMQIAPGARVDDGLLEVVTVGRMSKAELVANLPSLYRGTHVKHASVHVYAGKRLEAVSIEGEALLDVDGEPLGALPASIEVLPGAIELIGAVPP